MDSPSRAAPKRCRASACTTARKTSSEAAPTRPRSTTPASSPRSRQTPEHAATQPPELCGAVDTRGRLLECAPNDCADWKRALEMPSEVAPTGNGRSSAHQSSVLSGNRHSECAPDVSANWKRALECPLEVGAPRQAGASVPNFPMHSYVKGHSSARLSWRSLL